MKLIKEKAIVKVRKLVNVIFLKELPRANLSLFQLFSSFTPDEWEAYSSENIAKAERERKASVALRSEINGILMQTYVDLRNIFETVNNEFSKRIEETLAAKRSLEKELARVMHCFVFFLSLLHLKAAQLSRRGKPGQRISLHCRLPLSLSPSCVTRKKNARKNGRAFFSRFSFASSTTDQAKKGLLVVYLYCDYSLC